MKITAKRRDADGSVYFEVFVRSVVRPRLQALGIIEHGEHSQQRERQKVGTLAAVLAEELCAKYCDKLEPSAVARTAMEVYDELVSETPVLQRGDELPRYADRNFLRLAKY